MASLGASLSDSRLAEQLVRGPDHMAPTNTQPQNPRWARGWVCFVAPERRCRPRLSADEQNWRQSASVGSFFPLVSPRQGTCASVPSIPHLNTWGQSSGFGSSITPSSFALYRDFFFIRGPRIRPAPPQISGRASKQHLSGAHLGRASWVTLIITTRPD